MKEFLKVLDTLEPSERRIGLECLSQLEGELILLREERQSLLSSAEALYKTNKKLQRELQEKRRQLERSNVAGALEQLSAQLEKTRQDAEDARREANAAKQDAEDARLEADIARRDAEMARREADAAGKACEELREERVVVLEKTKALVQEIERQKQAFQSLSSLLKE